MPRGSFALLRRHKRRNFHSSWTVQDAVPPMEHTLNAARDLAVGWLAQWGDFAVVPALLLDPGGVPWPWIFLMLLAEQAGNNILVLFVLGLAVLGIADHGLYWFGYIIGRKGLERLSVRFPGVCQAVLNAEKALSGRGQWAIVIGRFLPFLGRWVGLAAGVAHVPYARFTVLQLIGASITVVGFGLLAHFVGEKTFHEDWFPAALFYSFVGGIAFTIIGTIWGVWVKRRNADRLNRAA